jgi:uncharacterized protein YbaP (TraB family)
MIRALAGAVLALALALPARAAPPMWIVRDADSELVIFGSIHLLPPDLPWRTPALEAALARADDVWTELPLTPETAQEGARLAGERGILTPNRSLFRILPHGDARRLLAAALTYGVDRPVLDRMEPWLAEVAITSAVYAKAGATAEAGVEGVLPGLIPPGAQRRALETPAEQISVLDEAPWESQIASLHETLKDLQADPNSYRELVDAWMAGDLASLQRKAFEPLRRADAGLLRRQVTNRNARWAQILDRRLKGSGRTVVVVGVGHLIGAGSLPERLRALGYSVEGP